MADKRPPRTGSGDATSGSSPGGKGWRRKGQPNTDQGQGASPNRVYRAPPRIPTMKERQEAERLRKEQAGDWQNNPDFDREKGGWAPDPSQGVAGDAFTVWNALSIKKSLAGSALNLIKNQALNRLNLLIKKQVPQ